MLAKGLELEPSDLQVSALRLRHEFPLPWNSSSRSSEWMNSVWDSSINSTLWSPWFWNEMYILRYYFLSLLSNSASVQITVMYSGLFSSPLYIQLSIKCITCIYIHINHYFNKIEFEFFDCPVSKNSELEVKYLS